MLIKNKALTKTELIKMVNEMFGDDNVHETVAVITTVGDNQSVTFVKQLPN